MTNYMPMYAPGARRVEKYMVPWEIVDKRKVYERDQWRCAHCGQQVGSVESCRNGVWIGKATADHVVPISLGGSHTYSNIATSCGPCNFDKGNDTAFVDIGLLLTIIGRMT